MTSEKAPTFLEIVDLIGEFGREVYDLLDGCETSGPVGQEIHAIEGDRLQRVSDLFDRIDALPFEEPGLHLGTGAMLQIALKRTSADVADAMVAVERKRAEKFHRRAQRAEGRLARSGQFMQAIYSWASVPEHKQFWLKAFMKAAIDHARKGSGRYFQVECSYYERRLRKEWAEREEAERKAWEAGRDAALKVVRDQDDACTEWFKQTRQHANVYEQLPLIASAIAALKKEPEA